MRGKLVLRGNTLSINRKIVVRLSPQQKANLRAHFIDQKPKRDYLSEISEWREVNAILQLANSKLKEDLHRLEKKLDFVQRIRERKSVECHLLVEEHVSLLKSKVRSVAFSKILARKNHYVSGPKETYPSEGDDE